MPLKVVILHGPVAAVHRGVLALVQDWSAEWGPPEQLLVNAVVGQSVQLIADVGLVDRVVDELERYSSAPPEARAWPGGGVGPPYVRVEVVR